VNFGLFADRHRWVCGAGRGISAFVYPGSGARAEALSTFGGSSWGALGNVVDRVLYGAVADFLNMSCCGIENPYAFNIADIAIFLGAVGLVLFAGRGKGPAKRKAVAKTG
jgi:signal peptidase II